MTLAEPSAIAPNDPVVRFFQRTGIHYGWVIAAVTFLTALISAGALGFIGVLLVLLFWYYGLRGLSLLYLPFSGFDAIPLAIFAVFYGLDWIATVPPTAKLTAEAFGSTRANLVFGWIFAAHQLGAGFAALTAGIVRTEFGSYALAFQAPVCSA